MAKTVRKTQKLFGSTAGAAQIGKFGSLAAGSAVAYPGSSADPANIQALANYLTGWFGAVVGGNSPSIEDLNALCFLFSYQLYYLLQTGVPELDTSTTYYQGSMVSDTSGNLWYSLLDNNVGQPLNSPAFWRQVNTSKPVTVLPNATPTYTMTYLDHNKTFFVNTVSGTYAHTTILSQQGFEFTIKDTGGMASTNPITVYGYGGVQVEGSAVGYVCNVDYGCWTFRCDGTGWWLV